jgi:hypothetical protein
LAGIEEVGSRRILADAIVGKRDVEVTLLVGSVQAVEAILVEIVEDRCLADGVNY